LVDIPHWVVKLGLLDLVIAWKHFFPNGLHMMAGRKVVAHNAYTVRDRPETVDGVSCDAGTGTASK
jgi:hypothetical protein